MVDDKFWMSAAFTLATRGFGLTSPNPSVGCVLVNRGNLVGRGWTSKGGRPHAEDNAIKMAGLEAKGSTAYVSLEPCSFSSHSKSCSKKIGPQP